MECSERSRTCRDGWSRGWQNASRGFLCRLLVVSLALLLLPGCSVLDHFQKKRRAAAQKKAAQQPKVPQLVGTIVLVSVDGNFVLIDNESRPSPAMGALVRSQPGGAAASELRVTEIRRRPFVIADIVSGSPQKGDPVFQ